MRLRPDLDGKLFVDESGENWLVYLGTRHRVSSPSVNASLFSAQHRAERSDELANIRIGDELEDGSCLVREHGGLLIYLLTGCRESLRLHHVTTYESFINYGFDLGKVLDVPRLLLEQVAHGRRLTSAADRINRQNWAGPTEAALSALRSVLASPRDRELARGNHLIVCTHGLPPGGAERQWVYLAEALRRKGFEVSFVVYGPLEGETAHYLPQLRRAEVRIVNRDTPMPPTRLADRALGYLGSGFAPERDTLGWLATVFTVLRPTAVFAQLDLTNILCGIAGRLAGVPHVVLSFRNSNPTHFHYMDSDWFQPIYRELANAPGVKLSGNSRAGNLDYAEWLGIAPEKVALIPNAFNPEFFPTPGEFEVAQVRAGLDLPAGSRVLLGVFRLSAEKDPFTFLRVCSRVLAARQDVKVVIAGVGAFREQMQARIDQLGLGDRVRMLGRRTDINILMVIADVLLLTSLREGMPNVVLEAMASGLPVVATDVGGVSEIIGPGEAALLHEAGDSDGLARSCLAILADGCLARRMSQSGKSRAAEFSREALAERHLSLLA